MMHRVGLQFKCGKTEGGFAPAGAPACPDIGAEMVMVAAGGQEGGAGIMGHDIKTQDALVEGLRLLGVADLEVDMAHAGAFRGAFPLCVFARDALHQ